MPNRANVGKQAARRLRLGQRPTRIHWPGAAGMAVILAEELSPGLPPEKADAGFSVFSPACQGGNQPNAGGRLAGGRLCATAGTRIAPEGLKWHRVGQDRTAGTKDGTGRSKMAPGGPRCHRAGQGATGRADGQTSGANQSPEGRSNGWEGEAAAELGCQNEAVVGRAKLLLRRALPRVHPGLTARREPRHPDNFLALPAGGSPGDLPCG